MDRVSSAGMWLDASAQYAERDRVYNEQLNLNLISRNVESVGSQHAAVFNNKPTVPMMDQLMELDRTLATDLLRLLPGYQKAQAINWRGGSLGSVEDLKTLLGRLTEMAGGAAIVAALQLMVGKAEMRLSVMLQMASLVAA